MNKMKSILKGKNIDHFMKRTRLMTQCCTNNINKKGNLFEKFLVEPQKPYNTLFITDKEIQDILESSCYSLIYV
jgi:hypothetical protein